MDDWSNDAVWRARVPERAFRHQNIRRNLMSAEQTETFVLEHFAHAGQQMIVTAAIEPRQPRQEFQRGPIETKIQELRDAQWPRPNMSMS